MTKNEIAEILKEIATLLELKGENPFKIRAYQNGARAVEALTQDLDTIIPTGGLAATKGIGEALTQKITELHKTGRLRFYDELRASVAPGLIEMLDIPGLGPKRIKLINDKLGVSNIAELEKACSAGLVGALPGFGEISQQKLLDGIKNREAYARRHLWWDAFALADPIVTGLRKIRGVKQAEAAGSLRRGLETVGDLDFIVAADANDSQAVSRIVEWFTTRPGVHEVTAKGETKTSVRYESGLQADLRIVPEDQFAFALHHFTGSKDHNVQLRQRALARGLSLSEWGLEPAEGEGTVKEKASEHAHTHGNTHKKRTQISSETELFAALGLAFIEPELREGLEEFDAADPHNNRLPNLVRLGDLRGAFHNHTTASDGHGTLEEMTAAAQKLGWEYIGIADHSKASFQARGLDESRLNDQIECIRKINTSGAFSTHIFTGTECDILTDGSLDFDDVTLAKLDYVVASVHNAFSQDEEQMTARIIKAIENSNVTMLGHLTGRLLLRREGYRVNTGKIIDAALVNKVVIELNASPWRLDMDWRLWRGAADRGLMCSINPDAHGTEQLAYVRAGINAARKGWLTKANVINTKPLAQMRTWLEKHRT